MSPTVLIVPSAERVKAVRSGSLKYTNGLAVLNQTSPAVPCGTLWPCSSRICRSPRRSTSKAPCAWMQPGVCTGSLSQVVSDVPWRLML